MNPPYGDLHLPILVQSLKISTNVISLQPVRWLQDPLSSFKSFSDYKKFSYLSVHVAHLISKNIASEQFDAVITMDLGIYTTNHNFPSVQLYDTEVFAKIKPFLSTPIVLYQESLHQEQYFVPIRDFLPVNRIKHRYEVCYSYLDIIHKGKIQSGLTIQEAIIQNKQVTQGMDNKKILGVVFQTLNEAQNFRTSTFSTFYQYCVLTLMTDVHVYHKWLPYMLDYEEPWIDERFYQYFKISKKKQKEIETKILPHK